MANDDSRDLILRDDPMEHIGKGHEHPRQPRRAEDQYPEEAENRVRVAPAPDVHERAGECGREERHAEERGEREVEGGGEEEQPRKACWGPS